MKNQVQLIAYIDRLSGGGIRELGGLLKGPLAGVFGGAHLLPFFHPIDGSDAGFDPIDHTTVDARLGTWDDLRALGETVEVMADLIVNHVSSQSPQFQDFSNRGADSLYAGMFLTYDRVFPNGATEADLLRIYRPRPGLPFAYTTLATGQKRLLWTTFTPQQIDIDVTHPQGKAYLDAILERFHAAGIRSIRLDAVGYAIKKPGSSCFMIPETFAFIAELTARARSLGMEVLVEIHSYYKQQVEIARQVDWVYDFALPPLVLQALFKADAAPLAEWLAVRPRNSITVLDTHDGIGVIDVGADAAGNPGLLAPTDINDLVETIHARSKGESKRATGAAANNLDLYQVNCTYFDALGQSETEYLIARAVQFFVPGIPQVYYVGLLAGTNDMELLAKSQVGRDINRHYYTPAEVEAALKKPVVEKLIEIIRLRNTHPAFAGEPVVESAAKNELSITWERNGDWVRLDVDFAKPGAVIEYSRAEMEPSGEIRIA
ncbi:MAG TPA: sucrose phosphorylase [Terracidiphilus sp.]|nr:sucrose phosphorylase [Terracidiphilus sp.]